MHGWPGMERFGVKAIHSCTYGPDGGRITVGPFLRATKQKHGDYWIGFRLKLRFIGICWRIILWPESWPIR